MRRVKGVLEISTLLAGALFCGVLAGCGSRSAEDDNVQQGSQDGNVVDLGQTEADDDVKDTAKMPEDYGLSSDRLIREQTFEADLAGIGRVTFASYAPDTDQNPQADVVFALLDEDGSVLQLLDGMCDGDIRAATECFDSVEAVSFPDIDGDGYDDVITISAYSYVQGPDAGTGFSEARIYSNTGSELMLEKKVSEDATNALAEVTVRSVLGFLQVPDRSAGASGSAQTGDDARMAAYVEALNGIYVNHVLPDGNPCDDFFGFDDMDENKFAVFDVDFDGDEELLISYTTASMAGMVEYVYDYDAASGELKQELCEFPYVTYYDNGIVWAGMSHNHGMAPDLGDFWPYFLHEYNPRLDRYVQLGGVDAWQREYAEKDYAGNPFPADVDADGDGAVYYLWTNDPGEAELFFDGADYKKWCDNKYGTAKELVIPYVSLTRENIDSIR